MSALGPLDRRKIRSRCKACARRKIKCEGTTPCVYCIKKGLECTPQAADVKSEAVFVNVSFPGKELSPATPTSQATSSIQTSKDVSLVCKNVSTDPVSAFLKYFFSEFLVANDFGSALDLHTIITEFQGSSSLCHSLIAIGALNHSRKHLFSTIEAKKARVGALTAYRTAVLDFRTTMNPENIRQHPTSLWISFFLGLFELMYDDTGDGFVKHFLHGTSRILQLRGPDAHRSGTGRSFFLTMRVFEICRSLIYSDQTLLAEDSWKSLIGMIYEEEGHQWHPKEKLFDLMIEISSLSHRTRVWDVLNSDSKHPAFSLDSKLHGLANEGFTLRYTLNNWKVSFQNWSHITPTSNQDTQSLLATIYYHAISIYLSGIFDYRPQFNHITAPSLSQIAIQHDVDMILSLTQEAFKKTNLGGILFFFPLRVAGARVATKDQAEEIVQMLKEITKRSFTVADAFVLDLKELWEGKGIVEA